MTTQYFWQGDTVEFFNATGFDELATATLIELIITKPSGDVALWAATQVDPTLYTDDKYTDLVLTTQDITYTTLPTDLDEVGTYKTQAHVKWGADSELHGLKSKFKVKAHLPEA